MGLLNLSSVNQHVTNRHTIGLGTSTAFEKTKEHNPLTNKGKKVMASMKKQYGEKKAKQVFYASINAKKSGSRGWHK